jgi:sugar phosphate isomerase/epimerase
MTWRIGLATGCCAERRVLEVLDAADEAGFPGIELGTPPGHFAPWEPSEVEAVFHKVQTLRCAVVSMHAPFGGQLDLAHHDDRHRESAIATMLASARALKRLGGTILVVHPTDHVRAHHDVGPRLAGAAEALRRITDYTGWMVLELKCPDVPMADYFRRARTHLQHLLTPIPERVVQRASPNRC